MVTSLVESMALTCDTHTQTVCESALLPPWRVIRALPGGQSWVELDWVKPSKLYLWNSGFLGIGVAGGREGRVCLPAFITFSLSSSGLVAATPCGQPLDFPSPCT